MKTPLKMFAAAVMLLSLVALYYLNFTADMPLMGHLVILPGLLLQTLLLWALLNRTIDQECKA